MKNIKVVHFLLGKANPHTLNGVNKVVHNLATEQFHQGVDVEVWGITNSPEIVRHEHDYPLFLFQSKRSRFFLDLKLIKSIQSLVEKKTIAHLHSVFLPEHYSISTKLKSKGIPWILTPHSGYAPQSMRNNHFAKSIYMHFFEKKVIFGARSLHALGESEVVDLKRLAPRKDVILVPNGQSLKEVLFSPVSCCELSERPVFGFCGRLARDHKGLDLLIQGFANYKNGGGGGELWLIGDGQDGTFLQELAKQLGVSNNIHFLGPMFGDAKLSHLNKVDVFVHTSRWDGVPTAVLEAAALRKPLLISKETNLGDAVRKYAAGEVLEQNTPTSIAKTLSIFERKYYDDELCNDGENALKMVEKDFSWPMIAGRIVKELYLGVQQEGV